MPTTASLNLDTLNWLQQCHTELPTQQGRPVHLYRLHKTRVSLTQRLGQAIAEVAASVRGCSEEAGFSPPPIPSGERWAVIDDQGT